MAREYVLVRIMPNGSEQFIEAWSTVDMTAEQMQALRTQGLEAARTLKAQQAGRRYVVYGTTETDAPRTVDDRIWDSAVNL